MGAEKRNIICMDLAFSHWRTRHALCAPCDALLDDCGMNSGDSASRLLVKCR
jgi:hypothetical protein